MIPASYYIYNHQGKGDLFEKVLAEKGYEKCAHVRNAGIVLMDVDAPDRIRHIQDLVIAGTSRVFCYPHAARPFIGWDGLFERSPHTNASFVFAEGHIDVLRAYGYENNLHVSGWAYSDIRPFKPAKKVREILFAPIHPNRNMYLNKLDKNINAATYARLLTLVDKEGVGLTVRHIHSVEANGLWYDSKVRFIPGRTSTSEQRDMNFADLVVGHQTYAWIAVAMGKPTVMMAEWEAPRNGGSDRTYQRVKSWDKYKHLMMFPLDILSVDDPWKLLQEAGRSEALIKDWKARMIGKPFDPQLVWDGMNQYL